MFNFHDKGGAMLILIEKAKQIHLSVSAELSLQILNPTLPFSKKKGGALFFPGSLFSSLHLRIYCVPSTWSRWCGVESEVLLFWPGLTD